MPESSEVAEIALGSARDVLEIASCTPTPESFVEDFVMSFVEDFVMSFVEGLVIAAFGAEAAAAGGGSCSSSPSSDGH
jgi:hypothetical protein